MANWQRVIKLNPEWNQAADGEITLNALAQSIVQKLKALRPFRNDDVNDELQELIEEFESAAGDPNLGMRDFDDIMSRLYDWGDTPLDFAWNGKKVCWIDAFSSGDKTEAA